MEQIYKNINLTPQLIRMGHVQMRADVVKPIGLDPIFSIEDDQILIGYQFKNGSNAYIYRKRSLIKELNRNQLKLFADNLDRDMHNIIDAWEYIKLQKSKGVIREIPLVFTLWKPEHANLIKSNLGYPVIDQSEF